MFNLNLKQCKKMNYKILILIKIIFFNSFLFGGVIDVKFLSDPNRVETVKSFKNGNHSYISSTDLIRILDAGIFKNIPRGKIVIYLGGHRIKISNQSSFVVINENVFQMNSFAISDGIDMYLPLESFLFIIKENVEPGILFNQNTNDIVIDLVSHNIENLAIEEKANGTLIRLGTTQKFDTNSITGWSSSNKWFYLTISGGIADSLNIKKSNLGGSIRSLSIDQNPTSVQIAFQLINDIENFEIYQNNEPSEIVLSLRNPLSMSAEKIDKIRNSWFIDTIVIDPGHGGKDPGATGKYGLREKFVNLDIAKRLGKLIEKNTNIKVIYTRDEDVFVPLWKRTQIANESGGKLFVSIHANANENRRVKGFETYILRPGKTQDAVQVAERENNAIKLEEEESRYENLIEDNFIIASLMQNSFMKESEDFAGMIQNNLRKSIPSPDRGVKQAGFYVLIGASMPHALLEVGFLSNPLEEKQLRKPGYRQSIAEATFNGIIKFKDKYEKTLTSEN